MGFGDLPLRALIKITAGGTVYTLGDEVQSVSVSLRAGKEADQFQIILKDENQVYLGRYTEGCKTEIWIDKNNPPTTKRITGVIEAHDISEPSFGRDILVLKGTDYFSERAKNLLVIESYHNKEISIIIKDLLNKYLPEITTVNVQTTNIVIPDIRFPRRYLSKVVEALANLADYAYFCDETLDFHFYQERYTSSGLSLTAAHLVSIPREAGDITPTKNVVQVGGGVDLKVDQQQTTVDSSLLLNDYYRAGSFIPVQTGLKQIALYLQKIGSPPDNLQGEIREDKNNEPLGTVIKSFEYSKAYVDSAGWYPLGIGESIRSEKKHWIVLKKNGDVNNTYRWYHDNGATGENAYSPDDITWTRQTSSFAFAYKTYYGVPILAQGENVASVDKYKRREYFYSDPAILSRETARQIAKALADSMGERRREVTFEVLTPDVIPQVGQLVSVDYPALGINVEPLVLREVMFNIRPHLETYTVEMSFEKSLEAVSDVIADILGDVQMLKAKLSGIDETTILDLYHVLEESLVLSDVLSRTEQATGTFKIGTAKIEFMNVGAG